jgi:hypothetical protein
MTEPTERHDPNSPASGRPADGADDHARRPGSGPGGGETIAGVRASDIEPYIGLRYLSKLFRLMALILLLVLVAEVVAGFLRQGTAAIATLLGEVSRLVVLAGLLWGAGDLAILLIDVGHDVRAARILLSRQVAHHLGDHHVGQPAAPRASTSGDRESAAARDSG